MSKPTDWLTTAMRQLRKKKGLALLTPEEAEEAYNEAVPIPISEEQIKQMVAAITKGEIPNKNQLTHAVTPCEREQR